MKLGKTSSTTEQLKKFLIQQRRPIQTMTTCLKSLKSKVFCMSYIKENQQSQSITTC